MPSSNLRDARPEAKVGEHHIHRPRLPVPQKDAVQGTRLLLPPPLVLLLVLLLEHCAWFPRGSFREGRRGCAVAVVNVIYVLKGGKKVDGPPRRHGRSDDEERAKCWAQARSYQSGRKGKNS
jgi:hypothetical protein